jgi:hypothetical protein
MNTVLDYIEGKGWDFRVSGDELIIKSCPYCGKRDWKFYVNQKTRLYLCFHASCAAKGHISKLKKHVGDVVEIEGIPAPPRRFKLGIRKVNKNMWLVYPSMIDGVPEYVKYRILPFDKEITTAEKETGLTKFKREKGATSILFNQDALKDFDDVIVTEGERDAISLLMLGYENTVGTTGGAQTLKPEWFDVLKDKEKIHLVFDADEAGQKGAKEVWASRLGYGKCHNVILPDDMDLTEYFMEGHVVEDFNVLLGQAKTFNIPGVRPIISILREMADDPVEDPYFPTPWGNVNDLLGGGIRNGEMVCLSSPPGIGKTTLALQLSSLFTYKLNKPTLFFCMEMSFYKLVRLFVCQCLDKPWREFRKEDALLFSMQFGDVPIYFGYAPRITPLQVQQTFLEARDRFGIELFVFDNLHTLIREHDHVTERIGAASKMFKDLAMETNTIVLLIAQPRKMEKDAVMYYYEIKGSSDIPADSDIVCLLHRNRTKENKEVDEDSIGEYDVKWTSTRIATFEDSTRFIVDKVRESAGGECRLKFDGTFRQFYSEDDERGR